MYIQVAAFTTGQPRTKMSRATKTTYVFNLSKVCYLIDVKIIKYQNSMVINELSAILLIYITQKMLKTDSYIHTYKQTG